MSEPQIQFEIKNRLAQLVLHNPARRNAITRAMWGQFTDHLSDQKPYDVLIVRGQGEAFSAGADIHEMGLLAGHPDKTAKWRAQMQTALTQLNQVSVPTIAWITGPCHGAGLAIAMACDIRFADQNASFSIPPAKLGLLYPKDDIRRLIGLIGPAKAKQILYSGERFDAETASNMGLINELKNWDQVLKFASQILQNSTASILGLKQMIDGRMINPDQAFDAAYDGEDFAEGFAAFAQKRQPDYH